MSDAEFLRQVAETLTQRMILRAEPRRHRAHKASYWTAFKRDLRDIASLFQSRQRRLA